MVAYISQKMTYFSERLWNHQVLVIFDRSDVIIGEKACTTKVEKWKWHRPSEVFFNFKMTIFSFFEVQKNDIFLTPKVTKNLKILTFLSFSEIRDWPFY
jgi:hypothetical protein